MVRRESVLRCILACDCENAGNINIRDFLQRGFGMHVWLHAVELPLLFSAWLIDSPLPFLSPSLASSLPLSRDHESDFFPQLHTTANGQATKLIELRTPGAVTDAFFIGHEEVSGMIAKI